MTTPAAPPPRRLAQILFSPELLVNMTSGTFEVLTSATPPDAQIRDAGFDPETGCFYITLEHEDFGPVELGQRIRSLPSPIITRLHS